MNTRYLDQFVLVCEAANQLVAAIKKTDWEKNDFVFFTYDDDVMWDYVQRLVENEWKIVKRFTLRTNNFRKKLKYIQNFGLKKGTTILIQDALLSSDPEPICDLTRELIDEGNRLVFVEFPTKNSNLPPSIRLAYLSALSYPICKLTSEMEALRNTLKQKEIYLVSGFQPLQLHCPLIYDDFSVLKNAPPIIQLPLGEVWLLGYLDDGKVSCDFGSSKTVGGTISQQKLSIEGRSFGRIVEVGLGMNPLAMALPTSLCEKVKGRIHIGIGDDQLIGGHEEKPNHFDILLARNSTIKIVG